MTDWFAQKLQRITDEFLAGGGSGPVFESAYLVYVECREAMHGKDPERVWVRYNEEQQEAAGEGNLRVALSTTITDRRGLVEAVQKFAHQFEGPRVNPVAVVATKNLVQPEPPASSSTDLLDFLTGDDE